MSNILYQTLYFFKNRKLHSNKFCFQWLIVQFIHINKLIFNIFVWISFNNIIVSMHSFVKTRRKFLSIHQFISFTTDLLYFNLKLHFWIEIIGQKLIVSIMKLISWKVLEFWNIDWYFFFKTKFSVLWIFMCYYSFTFLFLTLFY
jgi:hypothetical protein